jgi:hypothetical protein
MMGIIVLLLGIGSASIVYWLGTRSADLAADPSTVGYYKASSRQMGILYGQMGILIEDLFDDLKRPGVQAAIIVAIATVIAFGCFYFARPQETADNRAEDIPSG